MPLSPGSRLGIYDVLSLLGVGGMGEVYRARDRKLDRDVAIKVLPESLAADPERLARFEREARTLASLNHPNIAAIYGVEDSGGMPALVMELVDGPTLADRIARGGIPLDEALRIATQLTLALEAAHDQGIVHRDLKPANIKMRANGTVKVLDFGLAKLAEPNAAPGPRDLSMSPTMAHAGTVAGVILGTAAYMSPEQARGLAVDKRADIWAFGCVLYEMLTGAQTFPGDTLTDIVAAVVKNDPDWTRLPADTPPVVRSILRRCLAKDPARRLHDIADARIELEDRSGPEVVPQRASGTRAALPWAVAALAIAVSAALAFGRGRSVDRAAGVVRLEVSPPPGIELYSGGGATVAISPDGQTIAYVGVRGGVRNVFVRRLDQLEPTALRGTDGAFSCFFSPSGDALGFVSTNGSIRRVSLTDGAGATLFRSGADNTGSQTWGADDRITFNRGAELWQVPAGGGDAAPLTTLDSAGGELAHSFPAAAGRAGVLFTSLSATGMATMAGASRPARIEAVAPGAQGPRVVVDAAMYPMFASADHLIFFRDDALFATAFDAQTLTVSGTPVRVVDHVGVGSFGAPLAAVSRAGTLLYATDTTAAGALVWVSRGGAQQAVTDVRRQYAGPRLSPDGSRIVVQANGDLWIHDITRQTFTRLTTGLTVGSSFPIWTRDGRRVVFRTSTGIHTIEVDRAATPQRIPETSSSDFPTSISPDGETLLDVRQTAEMSQDVYVIPLNGHGPPRPLISTPAFEGGAAFSPDGAWIAYVSDESGQMQVYIRAMTNERRWQVSTEGGTSPVWNPNGRELVYRNGNKVMAVDVSAAGGGLTLSLPKMLFEHPYTYGPTITAPNFDLAPDGQRFVFVQDGPGAGRMSIVLNWGEELSRLLQRR